MQAVSLALLLKIVNGGGIEWSKKTFKLEKYYKLFYTITFMWDFFFLRKIDYFLMNFGQIFSLGLGQYAVFAQTT